MVAMALWFVAQDVPKIVKVLQLHYIVTFAVVTLYQEFQEVCLDFMHDDIIIKSAHIPFSGSHSISETITCL